MRGGGISTLESAAHGPGYGALSPKPSRRRHRDPRAARGEGPNYAAPGTRYLQSPAPSSAERRDPPRSCGPPEQPLDPVCARRPRPPGFWEAQSARALPQRSSAAAELRRPACTARPRGRGGSAAAEVVPPPEGRDAQPPGLRVQAAGSGAEVFPPNASRRLTVLRGPTAVAAAPEAAASAAAVATGAGSSIHGQQGWKQPMCPWAEAHTQTVECHSAAGKLEAPTHACDNTDGPRELALSKKPV